MLENLDSLLDRSRGGLHRIQKIVEGLRDFAHLEEADFQEADLNAGLRATVELMQHLAVAAARHPRDGPRARSRRLNCYPAKLNMVFQSLLSNAIDASPPGGRVVVGTRLLGSEIEIEVIDDRPGNPRRDPRPDLRPVLHHQADRQGDRPRPVDQLRDRQGPRRDDRLRIHSRPGDAILGASAPQGGGGALRGRLIGGNSLQRSADRLPGNLLVFRVRRFGGLGPLEHGEAEEEAGARVHEPEPDAMP